MPLLRRPKPGQKLYVPVTVEVKMLILVALAFGMLFAKELGFGHRGLVLDLTAEAERGGQHRVEFGKRQVSSTTSSASTPTSTGVTTVFQVDPPLLGPQGLILNDGALNASGIATTQSTPETSCSITLMEFVFGNSFGKPFVGLYTPPPCANTSNTVIMNFTVASQGEQFDRLAHMYLGDIEVWRTSTAEPKRNGIIWTVVTDMSHFMSLWRISQTIIFDLGNQVTANLTGSYNTTLTATFISATGAVDPADLILPISLKMGANGTGSVFSLPNQNASTTITDFPRNVNRALVSIAATGQGDEEFWWSNALQSDVMTFNASAGGGLLFGNSPFREVQLLIDGNLAGVVWPFPVIFTGGVVPGLWSPMVGIEAFGLQEGTIDISPWLGVLCDGNEHIFSINVVGLYDDGGTKATLSESVGTSWVVSGKVFIWLDSDQTSVTTGAAPTAFALEPIISVSQLLGKNITGANETLSYTTSVQREFSISSTITTQSSSMLMTWTQTLSHTDNGFFFSEGNGQTNNILTEGKDAFLLGMSTPYRLSYSYPMFANSSVTPLFASTGNGSESAGIRIDATISRNQSLALDGHGVFPTGLQPFANLPLTEGLVMSLQGTSLFIAQNGSASLIDGVGGNNTSVGGEGSEILRIGGRSAQGVMGMEKDVELWWRNVTVRNGVVTGDAARLVGHQVGDFEGVEDVSVGDVNGDVVGDGGEGGDGGPGLGRIPLVMGGGEGVGDAG